MNPFSRFLNLLVALALLLVPLALQADSKAYQVTGIVLELGDAILVVQKGSERWEIARDASTKVKGELAVGKKVTIEYRMAAASVEVKAEKPKGSNDSKLQ